MALFGIKVCVCVVVPRGCGDCEGWKVEGESKHGVLSMVKVRCEVRTPCDIREWV